MPRPVSMGFHTHLIRCHISFLHESGRREKGFVSWPRNISALFPKLQKRRETCIEALPSFHRDFSSPGPCVLHHDSAGRGRQTAAGEAARRARSSAGRERSTDAGASSAGRGRWTARVRSPATGARPPVAGDPSALFVVSRPSRAAPSRLRPPHVLRRSRAPRARGLCLPATTSRVRGEPACHAWGRMPAACTSCVHAGATMLGLHSMLGVQAVTRRMRGREG
jgi:hypothetical protein